jgi:SAM-dependent methyltransferase
VTGRRILDAGCGAGAVSVALCVRGAIVAGFDRSAKMVELARQRLGADPDLRVTDVAGPLPYPDGAFLSFLFFVLEAPGHACRPAA